MGKQIKETVRIDFSSETYSSEAVKLAAYIFSDRADIKLSEKKNAVSAKIVSDDKNTANDFANEVLNQQCRLDLSETNGKLSNMIVTKVLLSALGGAV